MDNPYLPILGASLLSVVVIKNNLHGAAVGRYFLRDNLRYVRVHTSTSPYLPPIGYFFLPLPDQHTVMVLLEPTISDDGPPFNTTVMKSDCERHGQRFSHLNDIPQRPQQEL